MRRMLAACGAPNDPASTPSVERLQYPETRKDSTAGDTLHGTWVADPYRWLENDTSAETADWVKRQNAVTKAILAKIPFRERHRQALRRTVQLPQGGLALSRWASLYFISKNSGLQNQSS
jgi:prolyl oligopeptidase